MHCSLAAVDSLYSFRGRLSLSDRLVQAGTRAFITRKSRTQQCNTGGRTSHRVFHTA